MTESNYIKYERANPPKWEWTDDFSKFGKDGWNYVKEWPDGRQMLGRTVTTPSPD